jgi:hypothetical protein
MSVNRNAVGKKTRWWLKVENNTSSGSIEPRLQPLQDQGLQGLVNRALHLQAVKGQREFAAVKIEFDHVFGGGNQALSPAVYGSLLDLLAEAMGVGLMISESGKSAQVNPLFDEGAAEGLGAGNPAKAIERRGQGGEGQGCVCLRKSRSAWGVGTEKNWLRGKAFVEKGCKTSCPFFVGGGYIGQEKGVGALKGGDGFTEVATGKDPAVSGKRFGAEEYQIDIPLYGQMLKAIIKKEHVSTQGMNGVPTGQGAHNPCKHWDSRQRFGQQKGLVSSLLGVKVDGFFIGDNIHLVSGSAAIATTDDGRFVPLFLQKGGKVTDDRSLAGAAHGQIADRDHRNLHLITAKEAARVHRGAKLHGRAVQGAEGAAQEVQRAFGVRHDHNVLRGCGALERGWEIWKKDDLFSSNGMIVSIF